MYLTFYILITLTHAIITFFSYTVLESEHSNAFTQSNSSSVPNVEPRKFSKYNPNPSRRSIQPQHLYARNQQMIETQRNFDRKTGYVMSVGGGQNIGNKGIPSKLMYSKNMDVQNLDARSTIPHGSYANFRTNVFFFS